MKSYADIKSLDDARAHVNAMLNTEMAKTYGIAPVLKALREDALAEWKGASNVSHLSDEAGERSLGASLVIIALNEIA